MGGAVCRPDRATDEGGEEGEIREEARAAAATLKGLEGSATSEMEDPITPPSRLGVLFESDWLKQRNVKSVDKSRPRMKDAFLHNVKSHTFLNKYGW